MEKKLFVLIGIVGLFLISVLGPQPAVAVNIAVYGDYTIDDFLKSKGYSVTVVSDFDLKTNGFLDSYDIFIHTRPPGFGSNILSEEGAANIKRFVTGNVVLFMTDLADMIGDGPQAGLDPQRYAETALLNAVRVASAGGQRGYIGEFHGAAVALSSNPLAQYGKIHLDLLPGNLTGLAVTDDSASFSVSDIVDRNHPLLAGLPNPYDLKGGQEYIFASEGVPSSFVVARGPLGSSIPYPTVLAWTRFAVPEPASFFSLLGALAGLVSICRKKSPRKGLPGRA